MRATIFSILFLLQSLVDSRQDSQVTGPKSLKPGPNDCLRKIYIVMQKTKHYRSRIVTIESWIIIWTGVLFKICGCKIILEKNETDFFITPIDSPRCPPGYFSNGTNTTGTLNCHCAPAGSYSNQNATGFVQCSSGSDSTSCSSFCTPRYVASYFKSNDCFNV